MGLNLASRVKGGRERERECARERERGGNSVGSH